MKLLRISALACSVVQCSCVSQLCNYAFDAANYPAACNPADIQPQKGQYVFTDGKRYYIQLPRYRYGDQVKSLSTILDNLTYSPNTTATLKRGETDWYELPPTFARYITGLSPHAVIPGGRGMYIHHQSPNEWKTLPSGKEAELPQIRYVEQADNILSTCTQQLPVVRPCPPERDNRDEPYRAVHMVESSHSSLYKAAGYTTAVLVDTPLTILGNTALIAGSPLIILSNAIALCTAPQTQKTEPVCIPNQQHEKE